ncbi:MAG TPA: nicotinate-nucleotide--dimethylbenzimidazole phosphoribosyltransferase, partial [Methylocella sp.]|nr:nicotinate-nucleotide--dimethylbenzimidazole phosphoribosyltransferase [Methylocella sp.]
SLGRLEAIAAFLAAWQDTPSPAVRRPMVLIFAANHGIAAKGVSAYPSSVTRAMLDNFAKGGAAINQLCSTFELGLRIYELALDRPTKDLTRDPALDEQELNEAFTMGRGAVTGGLDLICLGEMGIGNTTSAAAMYHALYGGAAADWVGRGTGLDEEGLKRKIALVEVAVAHHRPHLADPLEVLRRLGGREIAAMAGVIVAARQARIPVILDGYVVCAAAAVLAALNGTALDHCLAGHRSTEGAHAEVLRRLGKEPLLDLGLRLGEGSGAALAFAIVKAAIACHNGMATFEEAQVAQKMGS